MTLESTARLDAVVKVIGLIFLIISGSFALWQYHYAQEREFKKVFFEKQINVVSEVFDVLGAVDAAKSNEEKKLAAEKFWAIYYGKGRTFLDSKMFHALQFPAKYIATCINRVNKAATISCENLSASMSATGFANVAREQMSNVWSLSFSSIAKEDPWSPPTK